MKPFREIIAGEGAGDPLNTGDAPDTILQWALNVLGVIIAIPAALMGLAFPKKKEDFNEELRRAYEREHGKNTLWFSGPGSMEREPNESERRFIVRRFASNMTGAQAALKLRENVQPTAKHFAKEARKPTIAIGVALGLALSVNFGQSWAATAAMIALATVVFSLVMGFANFRLATFLPGLIKGVHGQASEAAAKTLSETLLRTSAHGAPEDLRDWYRLAIVDTNGEPVSNRLVENDIDADFFDEEIKAAVFDVKTRFFRSILWVGSASLLVTYLVASLVTGWIGGEPIAVMPETTLNGWGEQELVESGIVGQMAAVLGGMALVWGVALTYLGLWVMGRRGEQSLDQRAEVLSAMAEKSIDQTAYQSGVRSALMQEEQAIEKQISLAKTDNTPFFELGRSTGFMRDRYDPFAPSEPGMPVGLTFNDLSTHLIVLGGTGSGKTSGTIRPLARQWLTAGEGGLLVLDGKGQLPAEIDSENYQLIDPASITINPIEGLTADDIADTLLGLAGEADSNQSDPYWSNAAAKLVRSAAHTALALKDKGRGKFTLSAIYDLVASQDARDKAADAIDESELPKMTGARRRGVSYLCLEFGRMPEKQRGSIEGIASLWLSQITDNEKLEAWADAETGFEIESVCEGARVGVLLPESIYGKAGALVAGLLKKRVYEAIKRRGDGWKKQEGQTPVLVIIDEIQELLTDDESAILPVARSLGLYAAFSTQNVDGILDKLGDNAGYQLLGNLRSLVAYQVQTEKTIDYISNRMGAAYKPVIQHVDRFEDLTARLHKTVANLAGSQDSRYTFDAYGLGATGKTIGGKVAALGRDGLAMIRDPSRRARLMESTSEGQSIDWGAVRHNLTIDSAQAVEQAGMVTQSLDVQPNVTPDEVNELLARPESALVQVIRARVPRRDLVQTTPIYDMQEA